MTIESVKCCYKELRDTESITNTLVGLEVVDGEGVRDMVFKRERLIKDRGPAREEGSPEVEAQAHLNLTKS